ncbi:CRTAC1 family protein [Arenicella xantha]|uniref:VCBS repeat protein n=1 Tax=Arenicella xantha TaxID=644221 RepID=A0A395JJT7_9GAMM|nr:CRTAC1 family protein [Arenicella xantha]RBP50992.1 VCBS repeat protein [Arenicella xantha]
MKFKSLLVLVFTSLFAGLLQAQVVGPSDTEVRENRDKALNLVNTRRKLDRLVWGPEEIAQMYEQRIVKLWDDLLKSDDKFSVLASFPFNSLQLAKHSSSEPLALQIARYKFSGDGELWTNAKFKAFIASMAAEGYVLEQSEWHHAKFTPPAANMGAVSEVSFTLHINRPNPAHRLAFKGMLEIDWSVALAGDVELVADKIKVLNMSILEREKAAPFTEVFTVTGTEERPLIHPLLVYDLDKDGNSEIVLGGQNILLKNNGGGELVAEELFDKYRNLYDGAVLADFNGDGQVDFVGVDERGYPMMFVGGPDGRFKGNPLKISDHHMSLPKTFTAGDIDGDGDLDLHIANYKYAYRQGQMPNPYYDANDGYPAVMLRNDGDNKFTDVTDEVGLGAKRNRRSYSSSLVDLDDDQDMDLIVVSDYAGFDVYLNDGKGHFTDVTDDFGLDRHFFGMGHTFDDFDGDGKLDFYVIGMSSTTARRLEGMGLGRDDFKEHTDMRMAMGYGNRMFLKRDEGFVKAPNNDEVARTGWSWGTSTFDFDNDGDKDIFVANGHFSGESTQDYCTTFWRHDIYEGGQEDIARDMLFQVESTDLREAKISWNGYEHKVLYLKHNDEFINIAYLMGVAFEYDARAVVTEDIDNDGRVDLLVVEHIASGTNDTRYRLHIYRNGLNEAGHWIGVQLEDDDERSTIGATVRVIAESGNQMTRVVTGDSFSSQHSAKLHFGLGLNAAVAKLTITWSDGTEVVLDEPAIDKYHRLPKANNAAGQTIKP